MPEVKPTHQTPDGSKWIKVETPWPADSGGSYWQRASTRTVLWARADNYIHGFGHLAPIPQPVVWYAGVFPMGGLSLAFVDQKHLLMASPDITHIVTISTIPGEMPVVSVEAVRR